MQVAATIYYAGIFWRLTQYIWYTRRRGHGDEFRHRSPSWNQHQTLTDISTVPKIVYFVHYFRDSGFPESDGRAAALR